MTALQSKLLAKLNAPDVQAQAAAAEFRAQHEANLAALHEREAVRAKFFKETPPAEVYRKVITGVDVNGKPFEIVREEKRGQVTTTVHEL